MGWLAIEGHGDCFGHTRIKSEGLRIMRFFWRELLCLALAGLCAGCPAAGYVASAFPTGQSIPAAYKGLPNQTCGVMVWADEGVLDDFKSIQLDTAKGLQAKLDSAEKSGVNEVKDVKWVSADRILQYQQNHADVSTEPAEEVAPHLGVSRLIYVEIEDFATHPSDSPDLWRGSVTATVTVVEVADGKGKVAYAERGITATYPDKCPPEGLPNLADDAIYRGTVEKLTSTLGERFVPHEEDAQP
jgi:hypothetical protein